MLACTNPENNGKQQQKYFDQKSKFFGFVRFSQGISKNNDDLGSATLEIRY
jgi:hypothetical protein